MFIERKTIRDKWSQQELAILTSILKEKNFSNINNEDYRKALNNITEIYGKNRRTINDIVIKCKILIMDYNKTVNSENIEIENKHSNNLSSNEKSTEINEEFSSMLCL